MSGGKIVLPHDDELFQRWWIVIFLAANRR
ncbi:hypothetical protein M6B38_290240 [Iris pallida]|uniref:Uncharacterized protein n=1 Tax=Iris pallida TaxID=29817 RepID=A0AAX6HX51_IRIPA|nr:hypothetical protein M6B38_290240 [Iris pallida]